MRKINAFILAGFYLLLSTGAFACMVHCTSELFFADALAENSLSGHALKANAHVVTHTPHQHQQHKKDKCGAGKNCKCCRQHGMYVVRENVSPGAHDDLVQPVALLPASVLNYITIACSPLATYCYPQATGPPAPSGTPLYLQFCSMLI
jgi:hypothetical protein